MPPALNKNNAAVKRIMREAKELASDECTDYSAAPLEDDIFEWHCTLRGPAGTDFEGGLYHFRILLPAEYPFRPPAIQLLTPNGRFELNNNICISFTNYHEESWQPAWGVRTAIIGLQGFFPLTGRAAVGVGGIEYPSAERKRLAKISRDWVCPRCKCTNIESLPDPPEGGKPAALPAPEAPVNISQEEPNPSTTPSPDEETFAPVSAPAPAPVPAEAVAVSQSTPTPRPAAPTAPLVRTAEARVPRPVSASRPPVVLDTAICVLLVLVFALVCRRLF